MTVRKFSVADASFERSPGQDAEVFAGNLIDQRHGGPITIGYGRYGPNQGIDETLAVHDVMVVLEGSLSVTSGDGTVTDEFCTTTILRQLLPEGLYQQQRPEDCQRQTRGSVREDYRARR